MNTTPRLEVYTYYLLDEAGAVRGFEFEGCRDDRVAAERAREVLARNPDRVGVEVRRGDALVYPTAREGPPMF